MKTNNIGLRISALIILVTLFISPFLFAGEPAGKDDLKPRVTVQVDGLTCPFCAYGLEKRIQEIPAVEQSIINLKEGTAELIPKEGQHIDIDEVKAAVKAGGFTPREVQVALEGQFIDWNGIPALSIISTSREDKKVRTIYVLKDNSQLKRLKASVKSSGQNVFITGKASEAPPLGHTDHHPYIVDIESFHIL